MTASTTGVVGTTLLNAVQTNPTLFQSILGVATVLLQIILSFRQKKIEKKQERLKTEVEVTEVVKAELQKQNQNSNGNSR